mgnify:CR=1 FL=1
MKDLLQNDDNNKGRSYIEELVANLDGSFEVYKNMRELIMKENHNEIEGWYERRSNANTISQYLNRFHEVVQHLDYLHEQALAIEDYEFCAKLLNKRLWSHWKFTELDREYENA